MRHNKHVSTNPRCAISMIELIVVLGIIAVMLGIFFPAVQRVRAAARETVCKSNLRQINLALSQYSELVRVPPPNEPDVVGGWTILALQFLEQQNLGNQMPEGIAIDELDPRFHALPQILQCPTQAGIRPDRDGVASAHYRLNAWPDDKSRKSYSIAEVPLDLDLPWASSPELTPVFGNGFDDPTNAPHNGGYHFAAANQHNVQFIVVE